MSKRLILSLAAMLAAITASARTLVVYYSYTNHVHSIVSELCTQIEADIIRVEPAEKGLRYEANNYAIGSAQIAAIRSNPTDTASYPAIDPVQVDMSGYDMVIVAAPLWWSQMAAPLQSFLFQYGGQMAGKHIALIVSSASSGISGVVADARRLVPEGLFLEPNLWITSSQTSSCRSRIAGWLRDIDYDNVASGLSTAGGTGSAQVTLTREGVRVGGAFDALTVYSAQGERLLESTRPVTPYPFLPGCYVVRLTRGRSTQVVKVSL